MIKIKNNFFIAIEGRDGVGKTTCSKILADMLSAQYYETPPIIFQNIRKKVDIIGIPDIRFAFYLGTIFYASAEIKKLLLEKPVVSDRYIFTTIAYHKALGVKIKIKPNELPIFMPDSTIYLYANEKACLNRPKKRNNNLVSDKYLEDNRDLQKRIHEEFLKFPLIQIDTSKLRPEQVCSKILEVIKLKK